MGAAEPPAAHDTADIREIAALKARYFRTLDQQDWDAYRAVFTADVEIDTTDDTGPGSEIVGRDAYVDHLAPILTGSITSHHGHSPEIEITGPDTATGIWAMEDHIWFAASVGLGTLWGIGWYEEDYRRVEGNWLISRMKLRRQRVEIGGTRVFPPVD